MKPIYCEEKVNSAVAEYLREFQPVTAMAAINCLLIYAVENDDCYLCAETTDALKGLNLLLTKLATETDLRYVKAKA